MSAAGAERVGLPTGDTITIRPIRPDDRERLARGFDRLGPDSRYRRFLSPKAQLTARELDVLTGVDHHDHEALVALGPGDELLGVARFVALEEPGVAEAAIAVVDDWQRRGIARALLPRLVRRAREEGVEEFVIEVLRSNTDRMQALFGEVGDLRHRRVAPTVTMRFVLTDGPDAGEHLRTALRDAASGALRVVLRRAGAVLATPARTLAGTARRLGRRP